MKKLILTILIIIAAGNYGYTGTDFGTIVRTRNPQTHMFYRNTVTLYGTATTENLIYVVNTGDFVNNGFITISVIADTANTLNAMTETDSLYFEYGTTRAVTQANWNRYHQEATGILASGATLFTTPANIDTLRFTHQTSTVSKAGLDWANGNLYNTELGGGFNGKVQGDHLWIRVTQVAVDTVDVTIEVEAWTK